jgi:hypothetical protein
VLEVRELTVYDVADEIPLVNDSTVPCATPEVAGSGQDADTLESVQNASSFVSVGSVTAVHDMASVVPPTGAVTVVAARADGAVLQAVAWVATPEHVVPHAFVTRT